MKRRLASIPVVEKTVFHWIPTGNIDKDSAGYCQCRRRKGEHLLLLIDCFSFSLDRFYALLENEESNSKLKTYFELSTWKRFYDIILCISPYLSAEISQLIRIYRESVTNHRGFMNKSEARLVKHGINKPGRELICWLLHRRVIAFDNFTRLKEKYRLFVREFLVITKSRGNDSDAFCNEPTGVIKFEPKETITSQKLWNIRLCICIGSGEYTISRGRIIVFVRRFVLRLPSQHS